jgi:uncharacterized protein (TIGR03545 family)
MNDTEKTQAKKKKSKGPIRFEAIIPFAIFVGLVWAYFFFFFDNHVRSGLEYVATQANGAEVNIGKIRTSFWKADLNIHNIQVTNPSAPAKNRVQIGRMTWDMSWDALLRGKIKIEDASILEIAIGAPRKRPGRVLPPPPPGSKSALDKVREQALAKAQDEFSQNVLGDIAAILGGTDPAEQLKKIEGQLKSALRLKEVEAELKKKESEWRERIARLPQAKDLDTLQTRVKAVKTSGFTSPQEVQNSLQEFDAIIKEVDAKYKDVQATAKSVGTDANGVQTTFKELEATIKQDIKDLEARLKLPKLDVQSFSKSIFGPLFLTRVREAESYMDKARQYMPPAKTPEEKAAYQPPKPRERQDGRNYKFGRPNSYPLFWLEKATISSKAIPGADWSGDVEGSLRDVTDDPPTLRKPTFATFKGNFPKQELMGVFAEIKIDHITTNPVETGVIKVASFPISGRELIRSEEVTLGFEKAVGTTDFDVELRGGEVKINLKTIFHRPGQALKLGDQDSANSANAGLGIQTASLESAPAGAASGPRGFLMAQAKQPVLDEILKGALNDIPRITLNASVAGNWSDLRFNINSNLGSELASAFDKQIQLKINEARLKLQAYVDEQVGKEKARLMNEFNKAKAQIDATIKAKEEELNKFKNSIETAKNEAINSQKKKLEAEKKKLEGEKNKAVEDLKKDLKKKLPF